MTPEDLYLHAVINRHRAPGDARLPQLRPLLRHWTYAPYLESITLSGSHAKGTALRDSDLDYLLDVASTDPIVKIQRSLADHLHGQIRNVSVRVILDNRSIDLVPARAGILWQARFDTWLKTDIAEQIRYVRSSGLINEILALKIWRRRHVLRFPSFALELATIHALKPGHPISQQFLSLLDFLTTDFPTTHLLDPANSNNVIECEDKFRIAIAAQMSLHSPTRWGGL